uniref:F-box domain-containing protein n=1 Tax=Bionectria ochroleuca TaxID=29856 RepID=A0A8H7N672_BIOOC
MHHLFVVPEIVAVIVKSGSLCKGYLYTCRLVNRVFFQESARLLWYACGRGVWTPSETGHALANVEHLISVSRKEPQRAQVYANFICILQFSEWFEGNEYRNEFEWHHELLSLQFPQLQTVYFVVGDSTTRFITGQALLHYAQPTVGDLYVTMCSQLSDVFLDTLSSKCPRLMHLYLLSCTDNTVTGEGLVRFLSRSRQLRALLIQHAFDDLWSEEVFRIIEQLPNLHRVGLPFIEESWLEEVTGFQALTSLDTSISNRGLALLAASLPYLLELQLDFKSPPPRFPWWLASRD